MPPRSAGSENQCVAVAVARGKEHQGDLGGGPGVEHEVEPRRGWTGVAEVGEAVEVIIQVFHALAHHQGHALIQQNPLALPRELSNYRSAAGLMLWAQLPTPRHICVRSFAALGHQETHTRTPHARAHPARPHARAHTHKGSPSAF